MCFFLEKWQDATIRLLLLFQWSRRQDDQMLTRICRATDWRQREEEMAVFTNKLNTPQSIVMFYRCPFHHTQLFLTRAINDITLHDFTITHAIYNHFG